MSVTGTWNLTLNSPLGDQSATLQIQETGGAYQGTLKGKAEPTAVEELKVDGSNVGFSADWRVRVGRLKLAFSGTVSGDGLSGTYSTPFGAFNFSGTRA
jgi:autotransporter translocation and assembly factor TamB